jgi:hypothetical protein
MARVWHSVPAETPADYRRDGPRLSDLTLLRPLCVAAIVMMSACTISAGKLGEAGTLHAAQVVEVMTRGNILASSEVHESLSKSGISDAAIADGSVVVVRTLCCGPANTSNPHGALNPQLLPLKAGDVVEFMWPGGSAVNSVTRVLQSADQNDGPCRWDPKNEKLWRRVMYCEWMPMEGWVKQEGLIPGWYKPASPR